MSNVINRILEAAGLWGKDEVGEEQRLPSLDVSSGIPQPDDSAGYAPTLDVEGSSSISGRTARAAYAVPIGSQNRVRDDLTDAFALASAGLVSRSTALDRMGVDPREEAARVAAEQQLTAFSGQGLARLVENGTSAVAGQAISSASGGLLMLPHMPVSMNSEGDVTAVRQGWTSGLQVGHNAILRDGMTTQLIRVTGLQRSEAAAGGLLTETLTGVFVDRAGEQRGNAYSTQAYTFPAGTVTPLIGRGAAATDLNPSRGWQSAAEPIVFRLRFPARAGDMYSQFSRDARGHISSLFGVRVKIVAAQAHTDTDDIDIQVLDMGGQPICDVTRYVAEAYRIFKDHGVFLSAVGVAVAELEELRPRVLAAGTQPSTALNVADVMRELRQSGMSLERVQALLDEGGLAGLVAARDAAEARRTAPAPHTRIGRKVVAL